MRHVICHTHWDREWFAPSSITNEWLKELFQRLFELVRKNESYTYVLDGQTLILEDLLSVAPEYENQLRDLVRSHNLLIGPLYAQIDFRMSPEVAIVKNLELGKKDLERFGSCTKVAWMVDNFGFISQLPQLLKKYGIEGAFIWRGVNSDKPSIEFLWKSRDGSQVKSIFLIGGYRNLYGLSATRNLAKERLSHEVEKLRPFSLTGHIPLLDGYDLDTNPEDPEQLLGKEILRATPESFVEEVFADAAKLPVLNGEMMSGKYACVFPGTLSTRVYLKRQSYVVGKLIRYVEFLSSLNGRQIDTMHKNYLKTLIHDNICGVGVDQIHRQMQKTYRRMYLKLKRSFVEQISQIAADLESGKYVLSFSPFDYNHWHCDGERCYKLQSDGMGFFKVTEFDTAVEDTTLRFENDYYTAEFCEDGAVKINNILTGILHLEKENGDSYSTYPTKIRFSSRLLKIEVERAGQKHKIVRLQRIVKSKGVLIKTTERVVFDQSPLVKWEIFVDLQGSGYLLSFMTKTDDENSKVFAKMPFEVVQRNRMDKDLFDSNIPPEIDRVLLAARETGSVKKFPFQGFVALSSGKKTIAMMSKGVYQYEVDEFGDMKIDLVRSIEWIAKGNIPGRTGDAGPLMYISDARCEGKMHFELAVCEIRSSPRSSELMRWFNLFDDSPLVISLKNTKGTSRSLNFYSGELPWVCLEENRIVVYNPYSKTVNGLRPGRISTIPLNVRTQSNDDKISIKIMNFPAFPFFVSTKQPSQEVLDSIEGQIGRIQKQLEILRNRMREIRKDSKKYHLLKHKILSNQRTMLELRVSLSLNKGKVPRALLRKLNRIRAQKRIYDYIVELLKEGEQ
ncbi:MAG TPA: alpha-mannosidase [Pseudothermotoga sp.]|nr:alpha-mannosidase [Pseudothermotoga sp.]HOK83491.1 alpha-mannosidase [Pseudothermotoga sp.]HPP69564.1 alpha-mannosidase [Pseudothermotoga sp.]